MSPIGLRKALGWAIIAGGGFVVITCTRPVEGLCGFVFICLGCALIVDD